LIVHAFQNMVALCYCELGPHKSRTNSCTLQHIKKNCTISLLPANSNGTSIVTDFSVCKCPIIGSVRVSLLTLSIYQM